MPKRIVNKKKVYVTISQEERKNINYKIDNYLLESSLDTGFKNKWWKNKHNPNNPIPNNIYLLGNGYFDELYRKYNREYGFICKKDFQDYFRELIQQNIII
jgi:hypothetical protein